MSVANDFSGMLAHTFNIDCLASCYPQRLSPPSAKLSNAANNFPTARNLLRMTSFYEISVLRQPWFIHLLWPIVDRALPLFLSRSLVVALTFR